MPLIADALDQFKDTVARIIKTSVTRSQLQTSAEQIKFATDVGESVRGATSIPAADRSIHEISDSGVSMQHLPGEQAELHFSEPKAIFMARFIDRTLTPFLNQALQDEKSMYRHKGENRAHRTIEINAPSDKVAEVVGAIRSVGKLIETDTDIHQQLGTALALTCEVEKKGVSVLLGISDLKDQVQKRQEGFVQNLRPDAPKEPIHVTIRLDGVPAAIGVQLTKIKDVVFKGSREARPLSNGQDGNPKGLVFEFNADNPEISKIFKAFGAPTQLRGGRNDRSEKPPE